METAILDPILEAAWEGLVLVFSWPNILYPLIGTFLAMLFAVLPGVSGITLMVLAIPLTFSWDPLPTMLLFGALVGSATFMGSVTAILLNIPGSAPNSATLLDGYPMALKGQAKTAIGCSAMASALGSSFGIMVLIALIPVMRPAILAFGPPRVLDASDLGTHHDRGYHAWLSGKRPCGCGYWTSSGFHRFGP
jgi:TctA family transporter